MAMKFAQRQVFELLYGTLCYGAGKGAVLWRSSFQAHRSCTAYPRTSSPVTVATLRSAFQALNTHGNEICTASSLEDSKRFSDYP